MQDETRRLLAKAQRPLRERDSETALRLIGEAVRREPQQSECHNAYGVALRVAGRFDEAERAYREAIRLDPTNASIYNNLGDVLQQLGRPEEALVEIQTALRLEPQRLETLRNAAACNHRLGNLDAAAESVRSALQVAPQDPGLRLMLGKVEHDRGAWAEAAAAYLKFLEAEPAHVEALTDLGMAYVQLNRDSDALACFKRALAIAPDHLPAQFGLRETRSNMIPAWHIPMMNEPKRNLAYRQAIRDLVKADDLVLEIGSGAGLLAMMAAEAGAKQVVTCEMVDEVAAEAAAIVVKNGFADRIKVVPKHSKALSVGADLPDRADVLVSEILANDFVGEGALPSLADAMQRLVKPSARIIPAKGEFMGVLVSGPEIEYLLDLNKVCGFDVRSFAKLRPWRQAVPQMIAYHALSDDVALLSYDFYRPETLKPADATVVLTATSSGRCYGLLQWIRIELAPGVIYENHPKNTQSVWNKTLYAFPEPIELSAGDRVPIRIWQRGDYLYLTNCQA